jgi:hypothetical protein
MRREKHVGGKQENAELIQGEPPGGVGQGGLAPSSPNYSLLNYFVWGVSEL